MSEESYVSLVLREFKRLKNLADGAMKQVVGEHFFAVLALGDNSIAVIVKHVSGNLLSRWTDFLTSDGEKPGRDRETEFSVLASDTRENLMDQWERGWGALFMSLEALSDADAERTVKIRGEPLSVLQAINRQLTHYAYHVGQVVYVAKHYAGPSWKSLSIPPGASSKFNQKPTSYVEQAHSRATMDSATS